MKKRGFTIVELVIVIAVIAILAAVLIPTFSNVINKAELSADKQAVREMNEALAEYEASTAYSALADVETVMQVLANAGYNTNNWQCLTSGYEVYWYENDNRMVLYNTTTAEIEYPNEYVGSKIMVTSENHFFLYNNNQVEAQKFDLGFSSVDVSNIEAKNDLTSSAVLMDTNASLQSCQASNIATIENALSNNATLNAALKNSAGASASGDLVYYATREVKKGVPNAYVSMQVAAVGSSENPVVLENVGDINENLFFIHIEQSNVASDSEVKFAQQEAAKMVYTIFSQMTTGKIVDNATIILDAGTKIDCSSCEWAPCKTFTGYFGTPDDDAPITITGARLTSATGHASTVAFNGSGSKYFVTGFFGTVYGNTTIENVTFKDLSIASPASDYELTESDRGAKLINTRNTVGIIGGITDGYDAGQSGLAANVLIRNVVVDSSCSITGAGCVGGLVGYIGSANSNGILTGSVTIEGCDVHCNVTSTDNHSSNGYKSAGGIIGFTCRVNASTVITLKNVCFDGKLNGYGSLGGAVGAFQNGPTVNFTGAINLNNATINENGTAVASRSLIGYVDGVSASAAGNLDKISSSATLNLDSTLPMTGSSDGTVAYSRVAGVWTKQ